jgi:ubiquitin carboxyl-terminal hydrolase 5/13
LQAENEEPPAKITKLAIVEERDEDRYDTFTTIRCWKCNPQKGQTVVPQPGSASEHAAALIDGAMKFMSSAQQSEVKAWEEDIVACEHTLTLQQSQDAGHILPSGACFRSFAYSYNA